MPSANFYRPVAQAINNLNQQLNINAARDADRQAAGLKRMMLQDDLIANMQRRELAIKADARAEKQLDLAEQAAAREEDWQEFQKIQAERAAKIEADRWALESPALKLKAENAKYMLTPRPVNLFAMYPDQNEWMQNEETAELISGVFGGSAQLDPTTGDLIDAHTGEQIQLRPLDMQKIAPAIAGIAIAHSDPEIQRANQTQELHNQLQNVESDIKKFTANNSSGAKTSRYAGMLLHLKQKKKQLESQIAQSVASETPINLYNEYKQRNQQLRGATMYMLQNNVSPNVIDFMKNEINNNNDMMEALIKAQGKTEGSNSTNMKMAYDPASGNTRLINVPKNMPGAISPFRAAGGDPEAQGMVWIDGFDKLQGSGQTFLKDALYYVDDYINSSRGILPTMPEQQAFGRMVKKDLVKKLDDPRMQKAFNNETTAFAVMTTFLEQEEMKHNNAWETLLQIDSGINPQTGEPFEPGVDANTGEELSAEEVQEKFRKEYEDFYAKQMGYVPTSTVDQGSMSEHLMNKWAEQ